MIKLENITKDYKVADTLVHALKGISISFRQSEFVSILGPSGCGKTTLLNIIGGLDHYTTGDLYIDEISTKQYSDREWDTYRNHRVGFVFQSYNLIPHQTVLENVELALSIAGYKKDERIAKAKRALDRVGLSDQYYKKPNQLSGGQCQRVAIARALVNDPEILLADEPTGALDTETSVQIMDLIKDISKETLVIMVTHNPELAEKYSTRIIKLLDGEVIADSNPFNFNSQIKTQSKQKNVSKKSKLSIWQTFRLSARNLYSKFKRSLLVCFAGAIGIIGVTSVLAVSTGIQNYITNMQNDMLAGNPVTITETTLDINALMGTMSSFTLGESVTANIEDGYINVDGVIEYLASRAEQMDSLMITNNIGQDFINYLNNMPSEYRAAINYEFGLYLYNNLYTNVSFTNKEQNDMVSLATIQQIYTSILEQTEFSGYSSLITSLDNVFNQLPNNQEYVLSQYDIIAQASGKGYPSAANEIAIVVNKEHALSDIMLAQLGYYTQDEFLNIISKASEMPEYNPSLDKTKFSYEELLGKSFTWYPNNTIFTSNPLNPANPFTYSGYADSAWEDGIELTITAIMVQKEGLNYTTLDTGIYYTQELTQQILEKNLNSEIVQHLITNEEDSFTSTNYGGIDMGITYKYSYYYNGTDYADQTGYVGTTSMMSAIMGSAGGNSSTPNYYTITLRELGGVNMPNSISLYSTDFEQKDLLLNYLDEWNNSDLLTIGNKTLTAEQREDITYTDSLSVIMTMISGLVSMVTTALVAFTALSLIVSTVMIAIITYVSVIERIKEIGVIRSLGGRKKDVSRLFIAESSIIGLFSGLIGITISLLITLLINGLANMTISTLTIPIVVIMLAISIGLTLISGLVPARLAAKKDPVVALRSE